MRVWCVYVCVCCPPPLTFTFPHLHSRSPPTPPSPDVYLSLPDVQLPPLPDVSLGNLLGTVRSLDEVVSVNLNCSEITNMRVHDEGMHCA